MSHWEPRLTGCPPDKHQPDRSRGQALAVPVLPAPAAVPASATEGAWSHIAQSLGRFGDLAHRPPARLAARSAELRRGA
ncbi:MAG: hypothetical protein ACRDZX_18360 [Acidimicrobiales bacterium]